MSAPQYITGGIFVEDYYGLTSGAPDQNTSFPGVAVLPLYQGHRPAGRWLIQTGHEVEEEQVLTEPQNDDQVPLHASVPGYVEAIKDIRLPGGQLSSAAFIRFRGSFSRTGKTQDPQSWEKKEAGALYRLLRDKGVLVSATPLDALTPLPPPQEIDTLLINTMEPEPFVTLGLHLLEEYPQKLQEAVQILQKMYRPRRVVFACDDHTYPRAKAMEKSLGQPEIRNFPSKYPLALAPVLRSVLGLQNRETLFLDPPSLLAIWEAVVLSKPLIERHVVLSGDAAAHPGIYKVRLGMPVAQVLQDAGGFARTPERIVMGGPFRGHGIEDLSLPVTKDTSAILALSKRVVNQAEQSPCIRCGQCIDVCPSGLQPVSLYKSISAGMVQDAWDEGLGACIECGLCGFTCPSRLPLLEAFQRAKAQSQDKEPSHG